MTQRARRLVWLLLLPACVARAQGTPTFVAARAKMVDESVAGAGVDDPRVIQAMRATPRHEFVLPQWRAQAYFDMALPIGDQQTISSPFIVAFMTQCLDPQPTDRVLEIGTGSGYQAAVLSPLVKEVYSIEIVESLARRAARTLQRLRYDNVFLKVGDGFQGWAEHAPFDKIIVTCSPEEVPEPLVEQLRDGGLMVVPTGQRYQQTLYLLRKSDDRLHAEALRPTLFVPMTGVAQQQRQLQHDPVRPEIQNGGFEERPAANGFVPGWYYQRNLDWLEDPQAPQGTHLVAFRNTLAGKPSHLLQGFAIDGRQVSEIELSAWVRHEQLRFDRPSTDFPAVAITLYDQRRQDLGNFWIGPFQGTADWTHVRRRLRVPRAAREGILRIGLFGATGSIYFDDVALKPAADSRPTLPNLPSMP